MSWRMVIAGAIAGFAWLFLVQMLFMAQVIPVSGAATTWLTLGGLALVWAAVMLLGDRSKKEN